VVGRAKGVLMQREFLSEEKTCLRIQRQA